MTRESWFRSSLAYHVSLKKFENFCISHRLAIVTHHRELSGFALYYRAAIPLAFTIMFLGTPKASPDKHARNCESHIQNPVCSKLSAMESVIIS